MKIEKLIVTNFRGLEGTHVFMLPHVSKLTTKNGTGKTSFLDALRYITAEIMPDKDIITKGKKSMSVEMIFSGVSYERGIVISGGRNNGYCKIEGKKVSKKDFELALETAIGFSMANLKNIISADIFKTMDPRDFGKFILSYIPQKMGKDELLGTIDGANDEMLKICDVMISDNATVTTELIADLYNTFFATRKSINTDLKTLKITLDSIPDFESTLTETEIEEEEKKLLLYEERLRNYNRELSRYNAEEKKQAMLKVSIKEAEEKLAKVISATKPNPDVLKDIESKKTEKEKMITNISASIKAAKMSNETLKKSKESLTSNVCPFSSQIKCTTDKSEIINGIEKNIQVNIAAIKSQSEVLTKLQSELEGINEKNKLYLKNEKEYLIKIQLSKEIDDKKKLISTENVKPKEIEKIDNFDAVKIRIANAKKLIENKKKREEATKLYDKKKTEYENYDSLVKAFSAGGCVIKHVMEYYAGILDDAVNGNAARIKNGLKIHFNADDGLRITACTEKLIKVSPQDSFISYEALSKGEQTDVIYLIIDLINQLSGSKILLLDEMSVLDDESFEKLVETIMAHKDEYDHIILSGVHGNEILEKFSIPELIEG